jgi:starch phosphorylase
MNSVLRSSATSQAIGRAIRQHATYSLGIPWEAASVAERFRAVGLAARERIIDQLLETGDRVRQAGAKQVCYLSLEFLIGRSLVNNLINLGLVEEVRAATGALGERLEDVAAAEPDAALGNGGLGRLAACFLDSLATLDMPAWGYGINYEFGLFRQDIVGGYQREKPDPWFPRDSPWLIERPEEVCLVPVGGRVEHTRDLRGDYNPMWLDWRLLMGVPHDFPVVGHGGRTVNVLRLFSARSSAEFDMEIFNQGDYLRAVQEKVSSETVSKVLYPSDVVESGRELRLLQEYFLVACAIRDVVRRHLRHAGELRSLGSGVAVQMNDTHPSLAVAELMRVLVDEHAVAWEEAWEITRATLGYTNHTLLPEALERWPVPLLQSLLPRHLQLVYEINHRFLGEVARRWPGDTDRVRRMSLVEETEPAQVRMAHLAIVGSHSVNGVAALHSDLLARTVVPDFAALWPERFRNVTNGVTPRRWLLAANPGLSALVTQALGDGWASDLDRLRALERHASDAAFQDEFLSVKRRNKERLVELARATTGVALDPASLCDVQAKRIHEYKRQLLNALGLVHDYLSVVEDGRSLPVACNHVVAGKAAPGYFLAKLLVKLVNSIAEAVEADPRAREQMRVVFVPDFKVSVAEVIIPAADVSQHISTAGSEACGTGNMKFCLNGSLLLGTYDGANVEILDEVGPDNIYLFGVRAPEIEDMRRRGSYAPRRLYETRPVVARLVDALTSGRFARGEPGLFRPLVERLLDQGDPFFHLADLEAYLAARDRAWRDFLDERTWARRAILNVARMGRFSSDRAVREYAANIWGVAPLP